MPFLTRGKARSRQNRLNPPPAIQPPAAFEEPPVTPEPVVEELKVIKQEVTYRVPREERLLDLPLEEEVFGEEAEPHAAEIDETNYNAMPVGDPVSIGAVLKKKKKR